MKTAVIQSGGKQYVVEEGDVISVEKRSDKEYQKGDAIVFDEVLLTDAEGETKVGAPTLSGVTVSGTVLDAGLGKKISIIRFKNKTRYHKHKGHRQPFLKVKVEAIG